MKGEGGESVAETELREKKLFFSCTLKKKSCQWPVECDLSMCVCVCLFGISLLCLCYLAHYCPNRAHAVSEGCVFIRDHGPGGRCGY